MRIALAYDPIRHERGRGKFQYIESAFRRLGHDVRNIQHTDQLKQASMECDLVLFEQRQPALIDMQQLPSIQRRAAWIQWYFDIIYTGDADGMTIESPLHDQPTWQTCGQMMQTMDLVLVKERGMLKEFRTNDVNAIWFDQGCPAEMEQAELIENPEFDVILWGGYNSWYRQRREDAETLAATGLKVAWACDIGLGGVAGIIRLPGCQPMGLPGLISRAKICLHVDAFGGTIEGFYSDRIWLAAGAGGCCLRRSTKGQRGIPGVNYGTTNFMIDSALSLCSDWRKRKTIGEQSRAEVMAHHTYDHRCQELLDYAQPIIDARRKAA